MPLILMPKLSDTMTEGTVVKWHKKKGDPIAAGELLADIETDKATMEWESPEDGVLTEIYVEPGGQIAVGQRLALVLAEGEQAPPDSAPAQPPQQAPAAPATPPPSGPPQPQTATAPAGDAPAASGRIKVSPLARKLAAEQGVDLARVSGTGPGGRIVSEDVLQAATASPAARQTPHAPSPRPAPAPIPATALPGSQRVPLTGMRRTIAERLVASKQAIPHFYLTIEIDAAPLRVLRAQLNAATEEETGNRFTVNDLILRATIIALQKVPRVNCSFAGDAILQHASVNLAVAVAVEDGLVTPVVRDAQNRSLRELSETVKDLATRARSKRLKPEEYQDGTFTVSNLGAYGVDHFYAIINPPQAAILSIGAIARKPVVDPSGQIVPGERMTLGLSGDHRAIDGAVGAQFLAELKKLVENPTLMLV